MNEFIPLYGSKLSICRKFRFNNVIIQNVDEICVQIVGNHVWRVDVWKSNEIFNGLNVLEIRTIPITRQVFQHRLFGHLSKESFRHWRKTYVNDIDFEIWWIWLWKRILPVYTTTMKLTWTGSTCNKLLSVWRITRGNEGLLEGMKDY